MNVLAFVAAFVIGTVGASLFGGSSGLYDCVVSIAPEPPPVVLIRPTLTAKDLRGTWTGTWDHDGGDCTILIDRTDGNRFSGTLKKGGAVILFKGTFHSATRYLEFDETKVVRLGAHMSEWSLGKDSGILSDDGQHLSGEGRDKWGLYGWTASIHRE